MAFKAPQASPGEIPGEDIDASSCAGAPPKPSCTPNEAWLGGLAHNRFAAPFVEDCSDGGGILNAFPPVSARNRRPVGAGK